jgi:hypothetical protein
MLMRGVKNCVFTNNRANQVQDGANNRPSNFGAFGNTWNGSSTLPNNPIPDPGPTPIPTEPQSRNLTPAVASWFLPSISYQLGPGPVAQSANLIPVDAFWFVNPIGAPPINQSRNLSQNIAAWFVSGIAYELGPGPVAQSVVLEPVNAFWWVPDMVAVYVFISFPDSSNDPPPNEGECLCI